MILFLNPEDGSKIHEILFSGWFRKDDFRKGRLGGSGPTLMELLVMAFIPEDRDGWF
jgi:hypothetical protein